ncbi:hypothetical protein AAC387_Pa07g2372 [Persea americana]
MSSSRRKLLPRPPVVNLGCGCRRSKLSHIFSPKPKSKTSKYHHPSSSSSWDRSAFSTAYDDDSTTTFSPSHPISPPHFASTPVGTCRRIGDSVAVVKDSDDPYLDFQHSILQMIVEKEIYGKEGLRELLQCFLSINSPSHHQVIVRAFSEIWNGVFSGRGSLEFLGFARAYGT